MNEYAEALSGGHPNSLGNTIRVVDDVLAHPEKVQLLFDCYKHGDEVVRLRVSNAMKRLASAKRELLIPLLDRFILEVGRLDQASAQWTLAQLFDFYTDDLSLEQKNKALTIMKRNLEHHKDWIVLNQTMKTLGNWAKSDDELKKWLITQLKWHTSDDRKSVSKTASKILRALP